MRHRLANLNDLPAIVAIYNATIPSRLVTADTEPVTVASRVPWFNEHNPETRPLWVLERDQQIAAWLSFSNFYGRAAYRKTAELSIYVDESFRRQGIGLHLLSAAQNHSRALDVDILLGFIFSHNTPSLALFEAFGFARWGMLPGVAQLNGVERDLVILGRRVA